MALFVKQETNWVAVIPKLVVIIVLCLIIYRYDDKLFALYAVFLYSVIYYILRYSLIPGSTFTSVKLIKEDKFEEAIPFIQKDIDYFTKRSWIDKYRYLLMINSSVRSFREMSLCNMAYCILQLGKVKESMALYENVLREYPGNAIATCQLKDINLILHSVS